ncbi:MAG: hypothetical protein U0Q03_17015 [Acidimicrobiales bacterium]
MIDLEDRLRGLDVPVRALDTREVSRRIERRRRRRRAVTSGVCGLIVLAGVGVALAAREGAGPGAVIPATDPSTATSPATASSRPGDATTTDPATTDPATTDEAPPEALPSLLGTDGGVSLDPVAATEADLTAVAAVTQPAAPLGGGSSEATWSVVLAAYGPTRERVTDEIQISTYADPSKGGLDPATATSLTLPDGRTVLSSAGVLSWTEDGVGVWVQYVALRGSTLTDDEVLADLIAAATTVVLADDGSVQVVPPPGYEIVASVADAAMDEGPAWYVQYRTSLGTMLDMPDASLEVISRPESTAEATLVSNSLVGDARAVQRADRRIIVIRGGMRFFGRPGVQLVWDLVDGGQVRFTYSPIAADQPIEELEATALSLSDHFVRHDAAGWQAVVADGDASRQVLEDPAWLDPLLAPAGYRRTGDPDLAFDMTATLQGGVIVDAVDADGRPASCVVALRTDVVCIDEGDEIRSATAAARVVPVSHRHAVVIASPDVAYVGLAVESGGWGSGTVAVSPTAGAVSGPSVAVLGTLPDAGCLQVFDANDTVLASYSLVDGVVGASGSCDPAGGA